MNYEQRKSPSMGVIMSNPKLSKQMRDAWFAKAGSTKRSQARSTMRSIKQIGQRKGIEDGMGGDPNDPYGSATPAMGTTTEFANPTETGTTAAKKPWGGITPYSPGWDRPQEARTYASRAVEGIPDQFMNSIKALPTWRTPYDLLKKGGAEILELAGVKTETGDQSWGQSITMMKGIDDIFKPYEGVGEILVNDIARYFTGEDATYDERVEWANSNSKEVVDHFKMKGGNSDILAGDSKFDKYENVGATGNVPLEIINPVTGEKSLVAPTMSATGDVVQMAQADKEVTTMIDNILRPLTVDRKTYMASLDDNGRAVADKILKYLDANFTKEMTRNAIMGDLETLKQMFPGVEVSELPMAAFADEALLDMRNGLEAKYDYEGQWNRLNERKSRGYSLEGDLVDFVKSKDSYISTIDGLINKTNAKKYSGSQMTELEQIQSDTYLNFLTKMKGGQEVRYMDWIDKTTKAYDDSYNRAADMFDKTSTWIDYQMAKNEPVTRAKYEMYNNYMDGMYDQLALMSTNVKAASEAFESGAKSAINTITSIKNLGDYTKTYASSDVSEAFDEKAGLKSSSLKTIAGIDQTDWSTNSDDVLKLYGEKDDKGITQISNYNLSEVMKNAISDKVSTYETKNSWVSAAGNSLYQTAKNSYSTEELKKYEDEMIKIMTTPMPEGDDSNLAYFYSMNNMVYDNYFNGISEKLAGSKNDTQELADYIDYLSGMDYNYIIKDGKVQENAKERARKGSWLWPTTHNVHKDLENMIWDVFTKTIFPPKQYGSDTAAKAVNVENVFKLGTTDDETVKNLLATLKKYFKDEHIQTFFAAGMVPPAENTTTGATGTSTPAVL